MAEHEHHEADELDFAAGDFWVQIESSQGNGHIWDRNLNLSTSGNVARSYWIPGSFETSSSMSEPSNALPRFRTL